MDKGIYYIWMISIIGIFSYPLLRKTKYFLHMMQLEGYKNDKYREWMGSHLLSRVFTLRDGITLAVAVAVNFMPFFKPSAIITLATETIWACLLVASYLFEKKREVKKDLVFTKRAQRLFAGNILIAIIAFILLGYFVSNRHLLELEVSLIAILGVIYTLVPVNMIFANHLMKPVEKKVTLHYYNLAHDKVRSFKDLKVIGITGSFGKTSTKFITGAIVSNKYKTLITPSSYNTPMGLSKVINNDLNETYEIFVAEMGARNVGDIKEVANLCNPQIGILTSVGPAHLETFGSLENIAKTKYELIEALPAEGVAIFNIDNEYVKKLADRTFKDKILYGIDCAEDADLFAEDIRVTDKGSAFVLADKFGNKVNCTTKLLGKHNILNLLAGAAAGRALGMSLIEIVEGIEKVEPVEHRLQLIDSGNGVIVIDDAFNSNPVGAQAALDVLNEFHSGRRIIVTPGMVELGEFEDEENFKFGENIAKVCDFVVLVGKSKTLPIYNGLQAQAYDEEKIYRVNTLSEATTLLGQILRAGDVVLFENDLPDTFNEE